MRALDRGGVLAVAGIHLTDIPPLNYEHELFYEKELRSVTSNTRANDRQFLALALRHHVRATTHVYPMSRAQQARCRTSRPACSTGRLSSSTTGTPRNDPTMVIRREGLAPLSGSGATATTASCASAEGAGLGGPSPVTPAHPRSRCP